MIATESLTQIINDLKFVCPFAEKYHYNFNQYKAWQGEEEDCDAYLKNKNKFKVWGIILPILAVIAFIVFIKLAIICAEESTSFFSEWWAFPGLLLSIFSFPGAVIMFSVGVYMFIRGWVLTSKKKRLRAKAISNKEYYKSEFERYKTSSDFSVQRRVYVSYFPNCEERKTEIDYLIFAIESGRASSLKEALMLLDEKKHNDRMKKIAEKTMEYAKRAAEKPSGSTVNNYYYR